jgi:hypothetical protein
VRASVQSLIRFVATVAMIVLVAACSAPPPSPSPLVSTAVDCGLGTADDCDAALRGASAYFRREGTGDPTRIVVVAGRARTWHAEIHACFADGRYLLLDEIEPAFMPAEHTPTATLRADGWPNPPCS